jgi:hypothetical protein
MPSANSTVCSSPAERRSSRLELLAACFLVQGPNTYVVEDEGTDLYRYYHLFSRRG